jgi:hypothetical protein
LTSTALADEPAVVCILESRRIEVKKDGKEAKHHVEMLYAVNGRGEETEHIRSVPIFNSFPVEAQNADVQIRNAHGTWYKKGLGDFADVADGGGDAFITDDRWKVLQTEPLSPGDTLRVRYQIKEKPFLGMNVRTLPMTTLPVRESIYQVRIHQDLAPRYKTWNGAGAPETTRVDDDLLWTWSLHDPDRYVREPLGPPPEDILPTVSIGVNRIAWGPADSWESLAASYWEQAIDRVQALPTWEDLPARDGKHASTLELCLEKTQNNIRYVAIELGEGGLIPHPSTETTRRKYGDCKDMATVVLALLQAEQTEGALAAVRTRGGRAGLKIDPLPTLGFFNHMVVSARTPDGPDWLDATHRYSTVANPRSDIQGGAALVVSGPDAGYRRIPVNDPSMNRRARTIRLREEEWGRWRVDLSLEWIGGPAQNLRSSLESGVGILDVVEEIVEDLECTPLRPIELAHLKVSAPSPDTLTVSLSYPVRTPVNDNVLRPCWEREPYPLDVFSSRDRETDVYWPLPGVFVDTLIVEAQWTDVADLPDTTWSLEADGIRFQGEQFTRQEFALLIRTMTVTELILPASSWKEARNARGQLMRWSSQNLVVE